LHQLAHVAAEDIADRLGKGEAHLGVDLDASLAHNLDLGGEVIAREEVVEVEGANGDIHLLVSPLWWRGAGCHRHCTGSWPATHIARFWQGGRSDAESRGRGGSQRGPEKTEALRPAWRW